MPPPKFRQTNDLFIMSTLMKDEAELDIHLPHVSNGGRPKNVFRLTKKRTEKARGRIENFLQNRKKARN